MKKEKIYYFLDINLQTRQILNYGKSHTATHHGNTADPDVHRMFLPAGQFNKLVRKLERGEVR